MKIITIADCPEYIAEDNAIAKSFMSPETNDMESLSIAEITIPPGVTVKKHCHLESEEVYHIISGSGIMFLDDEESTMTPGQAIGIKVGHWHSISNPTDIPLRMIVTCSPPWSPDDQVFDESTPANT